MSESVSISKTQSLPNPTAGIKDYLELTKPKVAAMLMLTAVVGMFLATPGMVPLQVLFFGSLGIAMAISGAAAINHVYDQRIDTIMARTKNRPVATGLIDNRKALIFAVSLCLVSVIILDVFVNRLCAVLTFFGGIGYAVVYTMYLKRATPQNIVIGGLSGAIPPLLGWVAVTGEIHPHALLLVLLVFVWTPPHFWPLAIHRKDEYANADIPMLPVTHGIEFTKLNILFYSILLLVTSWLPYLTGMSGLIYMFSATVLGLIFIGYALKLKYAPDDNTAMQTFGYSILYIGLLFTALLIDHYFPITFLGPGQ